MAFSDPNCVNQPPKFKVGDLVVYTNDQDVCFGERTIVGIDYWEGYPEPRYFMEPSGNPEHYSSKESNFALIKSVDDIDPIRGSFS